MQAALGPLLSGHSFVCAGVPKIKINLHLYLQLFFNVIFHDNLEWSCKISLQFSSSLREVGALFIKLF